MKVDDRPPRRQEIAVLRLDNAAALAAGLDEVVDRIVRSTPTPAVPAMRNWSWTSTPPLGEDLFVAQASAKDTALSAADGMTSTVRVDFTGTLGARTHGGEPGRPRAGGNLVRSPPGPGACLQPEERRAFGA